LELSGLAGVPADSGVLVPGELGEKVFFAIDVGVAELALARALGATGVIAHHPPGGPPRLRWHEVLWRHVELLVGYGVPEDEARGAVAELVREFAARDHAANFPHVPAAAEALGLPLVGIHTPLDEIGRKRLLEAVGTLPPEATVEELIERLGGIGEFTAAQTTIEVRLGSPDDRIGRVGVFHGAGTNGGYPVAACAFRHGIDTVLYIHCADAAVRRLAREFPDKNLVVVGHIAADSLGINPFLAELEARGLEVIALDVVRP
ncbi:MAG: hypothetical protein GXO72_04200, partial [Caldiserica bacterium]|nr:hypothetical protein [Caldisericota bacterium]